MNHKHCRYLFLFAFAFTFISGLANAQEDSLTDGLLAYFSFDEDFRDQSGNKNHGRSVGGTKLVDGVIGRAASFDGKDDHVRVLPKSDVTNIGDFSFSVWTNVKDWKKQKRLPDDRFRDYQYIFDGHTSSPMFREEGIYQNGFFVIYGQMQRGDREEIHNGIHLNRRRPWEQNIPAKLKDQWNHMVFIRRGAVDETYLNGKPLKVTHAFGDKHGEPLNMRHPWYIGTTAGNEPDHPGVVKGTNYSYFGLLDEIRIYRRALTDKEVAQLFKMRKSK